MLSAQDLMTPDPTTIRCDGTIQEAIDQLLVTRVSGLPVVDEDGHLVGIISEFALLAVAYDRSVLADNISEHMTKNVMTVDASVPINNVADLFIVHRIRRLPVISSGNLVGIITRGDVLRSAVSAEHEITSMSPYSTRSEVTRSC